MKFKKKSIMAVMIALLLVCGTAIVFKTTSINSNPAYSKVVGEYDGRLGTDFGGGKAYAIGANSKGMPIFKNVDEAFKQAIIDYHDGFQAIKEEYHLFPVGKLNWKKYENYGSQITKEDENIRLQGARISQLFDIYENSFG